jgi:accessory colonization factor AcfC
MAAVQYVPNCPVAAAHFHEITKRHRHRIPIHQIKPTWNREILTRVLLSNPKNTMTTEDIRQKSRFFVTNLSLSHSEKKTPYQPGASK